MPQKKPKPRLTPKQHKFCLLYATSVDHFGNGTLAYAEAYGIDLKRKGGYRTAEVNASRLLSNAIICKRVANLLDDGPMTDEEADSHMAFWIRQRVNPQASTAMLKEYNALKQRIRQAFADVPYPVQMEPNLVVEYYSR